LPVADRTSPTSLRLRGCRGGGGLAAGEWRCDASTATWTVDRLERLGLAERRPHPHDRRAKLVVLTPAGASTRSQLLAGIYATPPELLELDPADLRTLRDLMARLPGAAGEPASSPADER
jgi:DNA-binding MarR family transcriptional regulator